MARLNNFSGLWGTGAVTSLVPGPGVSRAGGQWFSLSASQRRLGGEGSELVGLHLKGALTAKFTILEFANPGRANLSTVSNAPGVKAKKKKKKLKIQKIKACFNSETNED